MAGLAIWALTKARPAPAADVVLDRIVVGPLSPERLDADGAVDIGDHTVLLTKGWNYRIRYDIGVPDPRPQTPSELRQMYDMRTTIAQEGPRLGRARFHALTQEIRRMTELSQPRRVTEREVWLPGPGGKRPPTGRTINVDLTAQDGFEGESAAVDARRAAP